MGEFHLDAEAFENWARALNIDAVPMGLDAQIEQGEVDKMATDTIGGTSPDFGLDDDGVETE